MCSDQSYHELHTDSTLSRQDSAMLGKVTERRLISLVYPARCCSCDHLLCDTSEQKKYIRADFCQTCVNDFSAPSQGKCRKCGIQQSRQQATYDCALCRRYRLELKRGIALGNYQGLLKQLVLRMKRERDEIMGFQFGCLLGHDLRTHDFNDIDLITPIPTHWWRHCKTGFHAADSICDGIRQATGIQKKRRLLRYNRPTLKQGKLTIPQRFANLKGALRIGPGQVKEKTVLVVDDVMTSGATIGEAAKTLLAAGAKHVYMAVAARGGRVS